jgi:hypothetical protein
VGQSPHQFDPNRRPDDDYAPGRLEHLVRGNLGRLLDPRRTPVRVNGVRTDTGFFTVELLAFEDAGATWEIPLERVVSYQFELGCATAFARAAFAAAGLENFVLYRGMCIDGAIEPPRNETFVSASFDFEIARSCFGETDRHRTGVLLRQSVPLRRVFMTYLETPEMNLHYRESEAVLLHEAGNPIF